MAARRSLDCYSVAVLSQYFAHLAIFLVGRAEIQEEQRQQTEQGHHNSNLELTRPGESEVSCLRVSKEMQPPPRLESAHDVGELFHSFQS
jgi:hypothetical protein